jgi:hypothetical protein
MENEAMAKTATKSTAVALANDGEERAESPATAITEHAIALRAYGLYIARGYENGHDVEDWLQAERELQIDAEC